MNTTVWNPRSDAVWVEQQAMLDRMFKPFEAVLVEAVRAAGAREVLDVGCGTGATTLAIAASLGGGGRALGLDLSPSMIDMARRRAKEAGADNADFVAADAQAYAFEPGRFDALVSRFGVMFFADPVAAFANLRRAMRPQGQMAAIVWRGAEDNPFMTAAPRAAAAALPELEQGDAPPSGQFAFADPDHVRGILVASGWQDADITPLDVPCTLSPDDLAAFVTRLGPVGLLLDGMEPDRREAVVAQVLNAFAPFIAQGVVRYTAACWMIRARA